MLPARSRLRPDLRGLPLAPVRELRRGATESWLVSELTDTEWAARKAALDAARSGTARPLRDERMGMEGVVRRLRNGAPEEVSTPERSGATARRTTRTCARRCARSRAIGGVSIACRSGPCSSMRAYGPSPRKSPSAESRRERGTRRSRVSTVGRPARHRPVRGPSASDGSPRPRRLPGPQKARPLAFAGLDGPSHRRWCRWPESNRRPSGYKAAALPAELHRHVIVVSRRGVAPVAGIVAPRGARNPRAPVLAFMAPTGRIATDRPLSVGRPGRRGPPSGASEPAQRPPPLPRRPRPR